MLKLFFAPRSPSRYHCMVRRSCKISITGSDHPSHTIVAFQLLFCSNQRISRPSHPSGKPIYRVTLLKPRFINEDIAAFFNFSRAAKLSPASMLIKSLSAVSSSSASDGAFIVTRFRRQQALYQLRTTLKIIIAR